MTEKTLKAVYKEPGKAAEIKEIPNDLHTLQELVGGYIEAITIPAGNDAAVLNAKDIVIICDEEGKIKEGVKPNFYCFYAGDEIYGPVVVVGANGENFDSLTDYDAELVMRTMNWHPETPDATIL